jgi:serine O-acetyltransferase
VSIPAGRNIESVIAGLRHSREQSHNIRHNGHLRELPSRATAQSILDDLCTVLFPSHFSRIVPGEDDIDAVVREKLDWALTLLSEQMALGLQFDDSQVKIDRIGRAEEIVMAFARQLPSIRNLIVGDLHAALRGDPAATSIAEVLLCYRGTIAIIYHRIAHAVNALGGRFMARLFSDIAHARTGIDIHPAAKIGEGFFIDHGTGVVIGETAIIGNSVRLYQAVTLGARSFPVDAAGNLIKGEPRHPIIEDNVVIYSGATILGRITVGRDSVIGGNVWLTRSVPAGSVITQANLRGTSDLRW